MFSFGSGLHNQSAETSTSLIATSAFFAIPTIPVAHASHAPVQNGMPSAPSKEIDAPAAAAAAAPPAVVSNQVSNHSISAESLIPSKEHLPANNVAVASNIEIAKPAAVPRVLPRNQFEFMF
jgi:hypothetical protein